MDIGSTAWRAFVVTAIACAAVLAVLLAVYLYTMLNSPSKTSLQATSEAVTAAYAAQQNSKGYGQASLEATQSAVKAAAAAQQPH